MNRYALYTANALLFIGLLAGCSKEQSTDPATQTPVALQLTATIGDMTATRALNGKWEAGDAIGLCMTRTSTTETVNGVFNLRYTIAQAGAEGSLQPDGESNTAYFPADNSEVDFLAYHPYTATELTADFRLPVDVSSQPAPDVLVANATGYNRNTPAVTLNFRHCLTKLKFVLKGSDSAASTLLPGATLSVQGMFTRGMCKLTDGSIADASQPREFSVPLSADGTAGEAIVLPRAAAAGVNFIVTLTNGQRYTAYMNESQPLAAGTQNTFTISLHSTSVPVSATIEPWQDGLDADVNASEVEVEAVSPTPDSPNSGFAPGDAFTLWAGNVTGAGYSYLLGEDHHWTATPRLYWNVITSNPTTFYALHTPAATPTGNSMPDLLAATATIERFAHLRLAFHHLAAQVNVVLKPGQGLTQQEVEKAVVILPQAVTDYSLAGITLTPGTTRQDVTLSGTAGQRTALLVPQIIAPGSNLLMLTIDEQPYYLKATAENGVLQGGKSYTLTVSVNRTEATATVSVTPWTEGGENEGNAGMELNN